MVWMERLRIPVTVIQTEVFFRTLDVKTANPYMVSDHGMAINGLK